ncbi:MAG: glycosyltransferase family 39 protein [Pseudoxanthomonas sp.]
MPSPASAAPERLSTRTFWILLALAILSIAAGIGLREPTPPDEPRFALAARHMVESGQWLFPQRGSELYAEKPPTFMWLQGLSYEVVRDWRIAFLLPSLLSALLTLWLVYDLGKRLWNRQVGRYAALGVFVCLQFGLMAKRAQIDMTVVGMMTLSLWGLLRHLLRGPDWRACWLGCFAAGLGTVTKGVGFLPMLVLLPWLALRLAHGPRLQWSAANLGRSALGLGFFVLGAGVWLFPMVHAAYLGSDPALRRYANEILFRQTATRYANAWHHVKPWWYFGQVVLTLWLPLSWLLPWLAPAWWRRLKRLDARYVLLLGWGLLVLLFFSASPGKREVYILPALPAFVLAAAPLLPGLLKRGGVRRLLLGYLSVLAAVFLLGSVSALAGHGHWADKQATMRGMDAATVRTMLTWLLALGVAWLAAALYGWRSRKVWPALVVATAALWIVFGIGLTPALTAGSSAQALMQRVGQRIGPDAELALIGWREQNLLQADRPARDFGFKKPWQQQWVEAEAWLAENPEKRWVFVLDEALTPCADPQQVVAIGRSNRRAWLLVPGTAWKPGCATPKLEGQAAYEVDDDDE